MSKRRQRVLAASDCERCRPGLVTQPANTLSSLGYVGVGVELMRRARHPTRTPRWSDDAIGWSMVAVGLGSVAYHGPGTAAGRWLHDASLLAMTGTIALTDLSETTRMPPTTSMAVVLAASAVLAQPRTSMATQAVAASVAIVLEIRRFLDREHASPRDRRRGATAAGLMAAGLVFQVQGRTGRPWCRPDGVIQPHAVWHLLSATALYLRSLPPDSQPALGST